MAWLGRVIAWLAILGVAAVFTIAVLIPRVAGATPYVVLTGSMEPEMPPGTMVVVRPVSPRELGVGSVITYQLKSGKPEVITHRIISAGYDGKGRRIFRTQGDANDSADPGWVRSVQIRGERWYSVPQLGHVTNLLSGQQRQIGLIAVVTGLLGYAAVMFAGAIRDRRRSRASDTLTRGR